MCKKKILIIEDNWDHYTKLNNFLSREYEIVNDFKEDLIFMAFRSSLNIALDNSSTKAKEHINKIKEQIKSFGSIDLIILDYELELDLASKGRNGIDFKQVFLNEDQYSDIPILIVTKMTNNPETNNNLNNIIEKENNLRRRKYIDIISKTGKWLDNECNELNDEIKRKIQELNEKYDEYKSKKIEELQSDL